MTSDYVSDYEQVTGQKVGSPIETKVITAPAPPAPAEPKKAEVK